jgi:rhodanese-related sulfurtransferase
MLDLLKNLFGFGPKVDIAELLRNGATIVDVRTKSEYAGGHVKGSVNIPLDQIGKQIDKLKKHQPIVTCCASGMRSGSAASMLKSKGIEAYNGGSWASVNNKLR